MPPKRSKEPKRDPSPLESPRRKSLRVAGLSPRTQSPAPRIAASPAAETSRAQRELSVMTGISDISTDAEPAPSWPELADRAKKRVRQYVAGNRGESEDKLIACLLAMIDWLPQGGRESAARDIVNCDDDDKLYGVFANYCSGLLAPMMTTSRRSSITPSPHSNRLANVETVAAALPDPKARDPRFRPTILRRDGYRCIVTKAMETAHWEEIGEPVDVTTSDLEAAHIIPFAYAKWQNLPGPAHEASNAWEILFRCFPNVRKAGMAVKNIDDPSNGISLSDGVHKQFGKFRCAFIPTGTPNEYIIKTYKRFSGLVLPHLPADRLVKIQAAADATEINLPNPVFLECHYRVAEILNSSGMAEVIEKKMRDWEDTKAAGHGSLNEDGSTDISRYLRLGLWQSVVG